MSSTRSFTQRQAMAFLTYFDVADEIWPRPDGQHLTLADMEKRSVDEARQVADELDLPWPPDLAVAEEYILDHGPAIRHAVDWKPINMEGHTQ